MDAEALMHWRSMTMPYTDATADFSVTQQRRLTLAVKAVGQDSGLVDTATNETVLLRLTEGGTF